jgi:hypothetical protein
VNRSLISNYFSVIGFPAPSENRFCNIFTPTAPVLG